MVRNYQSLLQQCVFLFYSRQPFLSRNYGLKMVGEDKPKRIPNGAKV